MRDGAREIPKFHGCYFTVGALRISILQEASMTLVCCAVSGNQFGTGNGHGRGTIAIMQKGL